MIFLFSRLVFKVWSFRLDGDVLMMRLWRLRRRSDPNPDPQVTKPNLDPQVTKPNPDPQVTNQTLILR